MRDDGRGDVLGRRNRAARPHEQRLPIDPWQLREAVLAAFDLPHPQAAPYVEASAQDRTLVVHIEAVRRSEAVLRRRAGRRRRSDGRAVPRRLSGGADPAGRRAPQPGAVPVARLLQRRVDEAC